mgnify:CR=1 FL=1
MPYDCKASNGAFFKTAHPSPGSCLPCEGAAPGLLRPMCWLDLTAKASVAPDAYGQKRLFLRALETAVTKPSETWYLKGM